MSKRSEQARSGRWSRRGLLAGVGASLLPLPAARAAAPIYIADMHFHLFFVGKRPASGRSLAQEMAQGRATLVSWSLVGDMPWLMASGRGFRQKSEPKAGEPTTWLDEELSRVLAYASKERLPIARTPADVERAVSGQPHLVLSVEGATFADDGIRQLKTAYDRGVRHVQLVHFIRNRIGDLQTEAAQHNGLTDFGKSVVLECNRLGILIDLAHCTETVVEQVLAMTKVPVVWSHSSVQVRRPLLPSLAAWRNRQLSLKTARAIADAGGVVGLWALSGDVGLGVDSYARRILELADQLGDTGVAFGTDMNAIAVPAITSFADLQQVLAVLERLGASPARIRRIAMENYARALTTAMKARTA